ncbi:MAG: Zn-dependent protease [Chitinophagaceae bacterium]|nr:MAG: Zn-dependent protease [Chitinophagaceae bacterium]
MHSYRLLYHSLAFVALLLLASVLACTGKGASSKAGGRDVHDAQKGSVSRTVLLLPLGTFSKPDALRLQQRLQAVCGSVRLLPSEPLPRSAWYAPRQRFRADSLIHQMARRARPGEVYIGVTDRDISSTKNGIADWGIMGLGYRPGPACVVSTFRLHNRSRQEEFFKVAIHELGHTVGLPHCPVRTCFMRDAEGRNPTGEEKEFCAGCRSRLIAQGWRL